MSLKSYLTRLIWFCVLPLVLLSSYLAIDRVNSLRTHQYQQAANLVRNFASSIDQLIGAQIDALHVLTVSPLLDDPPRLAEFYQQAQGFRHNMHNHILLADLSRQMLLNTRVPFGTPLPLLPEPKGQSSVAIALKTGKPAVGDLLFGPVAKEPLVTIAVPVIRNEQIKYLLLSLVDTSRFKQRLDGFAIPEGCTLTVLDGKGEVIVSRTTENQKTASSSFGEGDKIAVKLTRSPWSVVLDVSNSNFSSSVYSAAIALAAAILGATLVSVMGGMLSSRKLARDVELLTDSDSTRSAQPFIAEIKAVHTTLNSMAAAREEAKAVLQESEQRYRGLVETVPIAIFINRDNHIEYANPSAVELFGCDSKEEILDRSPYEFMHPEYHDEMARRIKILQDNGEVPLIEARVVQKGGLERDVEVIAVKLADQKGLSLLVMMKDITERRQAENANAKLEVQLRQAQKMESVGRLAGGVAHDFNNLLSVILGYTNMSMMELRPTDPLYSNLEEICRAAERSAELTKQLLAFARKQTIAPKVLDLNETVSGMLKMLQRIIGEDIHLVWQPSAGIWSVNMDPSQIDQILANLCVNSRDAISDTGKITIETRNISIDKEYCEDNPGFMAGDYVMLAVSDDGCGMGKSTLAQIFEPFFTTKAVGKGTGLGLATVFGIVKQNNGFINVYSEPGHGTTFKIYLPKYSGDSEPFKTEKVSRPFTGGGETILLVEDDPAILKMTTRLLEKHGYTVIAAGTPHDALNTASEYSGKVDLLMTDVVMPEMNGKVLSEKLLKLHPEMRCLFMSGYTANVIAHHGVLDAGVHFIAKPFSVGDLTVKVREVLDSGKVL